MLIDRYVRIVNPSPGHMPTKGMARFTGGVNVILALESLQAKKSAELLHYRGADIKNVEGVNFVDTKPKTGHNWMFCLWMVILGILWLQT